jgi:zinc transporter ZupT
MYIVGALIIAVATLVGAGLAGRNAGGRDLYLGATGGALLVIAGLHLIPDAISGARDAGFAWWIVPAVAVAVFCVACVVMRLGCACQSDRESSCGAGAAAALAGHRLLEGAALTLAASTPVTLAFTVHALAEGMGAGTLLSGASRGRRAAWLAAMCAAPVAGAALAGIWRVPGSVEPLLLAVAAGVLAGAARVSLGAALPKVTSVLAALVAAGITAAAVLVVG